MKTIIAALILLLCTDALAQPNGDDNKPFKVIDRQARRIDQGQHDCTSTTTTILTTARLSGCYSLLIRNSGTARVGFCVDGAACTTATAGMYADEGDVIIYDKELNSAVNDTGIECDAPSGTNTVYFTLACAQ